MTGTRAAWTLAVVLTVTGCENGGGSSLGGPNALELAVEAPVAIAFSTIASVHYRIVSSDGASLEGLLDRSGATGARNRAPNRFWRSGTLRVAEDRYVLELNVRNEIGETVCSDSASFEVASGVTTEVYRPRPCGTLGTEPMGAAVVVFEAPQRRLDESTLVPRDFDVTVTCDDAEDLFFPVGTSRDPATADFGAGPVQTDRWRATLTELPAGRCHADVRELAESFGDACGAEADFTVAADDTATVSFIVPCSP